VAKNNILRLGLVVGFLITLVTIGGCVPAGEPGDGASSWPMLLFLLLIFGVFYLLLIRPQRKRQKEHQKLVEELKRGDKVVTAGGIYGVIENISEDSLVIKVESGATLRVARTSVALKREQ
jgi:preprotein translocase subunit YajC